MLYQITAQLKVRTKGMAVRMVQIPTFFLDSNIQGIMSERHCRQIAEEIINPLGRKDVEVFIDAVKVEGT